MAPTPTTTLRLPVELRDEIAVLAELQGTTLLDVVAQAVTQLKQDRFWATVHERLDAMTAEELADYEAETDSLDGTATDGLRDS